MCPTLTMPGGAEEGFSSPTLSMPGLIMVSIPGADIEVMCTKESISPGESKYVSQVEVEVGEPGVEGQSLCLLVENVTGRVSPC